ncbi:MAG: UDP-N-acetylmuramoyl-L-alanine--D-glutamate ligase [Proteobacteria bacterium]|nr:UDP-N-acetylmuramoyl-L-alanine--D-glutamate ligase [Pseudomonadota bacterium]
MRISELDGRKVALWGWGHEARAAYAALRKRLPTLALTVLCLEAEAAGVVALGDPLLRVATTADADTLATFDVVVKSPGISAYKPEALAAAQRGTVFTSGTALWFGERPDARVIAITGTKGKSTTSAMTAHIARELGVRTALAGNIGMPLLELLDAQAQLWVIELSSFQTGEAGLVDVGVITNLHEEHLDWHGSRERYVADKLKLADVAKTLVIGAGQPGLLARTASHPHRVLYPNVAGWHVSEKSPDLCHGRHVMDDVTVAFATLAGKHNWNNALGALTALEATGLMDDRDAAYQSLAGFAPLPHRLQPLGERAGLHWIDDSISTTPEATLAALRSLPGRDVTAILGGHDRGIDWCAFAERAAHWPQLRIITQGDNGPRIAAQLRAAGFDPAALHETAALDPAMELARRITPPGGVVLLSPGAPSFDQFPNYIARGQAFARLAGFDAEAIGRIQGLGIA